MAFIVKISISNAKRQHLSSKTFDPITVKLIVIYMMNEWIEQRLHCRMSFRHPSATTA